MPHRRYPIGAEVLPEGGVSFRVWAPRRKRVEVVLEPGAATDLHAESSGYFSGVFSQAAAGARYRFRLDSGDRTPIPRRVSNRRVRTARRERWTLRASPGAIRRGREFRSRDR